MSEAEKKVWQKIWSWFQNIWNDYIRPKLGWDKLKISLIKKGTVIDRITAGQALKVLKILGIEAGTDQEVSVAINVPSRKIGKKDIVKIEGRILGPLEVNKIAIIAPHATINIIEDTKVVEKYDVKLPKKLEGIIKCQNPTCITRAVRDDEPTIPKEPVKMRFITINPESEKPEFECDYCHSRLNRKEAIEALI